MHLAEETCLKVDYNAHQSFSKTRGIGAFGGSIHDLDKLEFIRVDLSRMNNADYVPKGHPA